MPNSTTKAAAGHSAAFSSHTKALPLELNINGLWSHVDTSNPAMLAIFVAFLGSTVMRAELLRFFRAFSALQQPMRQFAKARPFSFLVGSFVHPFMVPSLPPMFRSYVEAIHKDQTDSALEAFLTADGREAFSAYVGLVLRGLHVGRAVVPEMTPDLETLLFTSSVMYKQLESEELRELVRSVFAEYGLALEEGVESTEN